MEMEMEMEKPKPTPKKFRVWTICIGTQNRVRAKIIEPELKLVWTCEELLDNLSTPKLCDMYNSICHK